MGNWFSKTYKKVRKEVKKTLDIKKSLPVAGAIVGGVAGFMLGGPAGAMIGAGMGMSMTSQTQSMYNQNKYNQANLKLQKKAYAQQSAELERQRQIEIDQQKRENMQLMNAVTDLSNVSYGGQSSPSVSYDKYGDLG